MSPTAAGRLTWLGLKKLQSLLGQETAGQLFVTWWSHVLWERRAVVSRVTAGPGKGLWSV